MQFRFTLLAAATLCLGWIDGISHLSAHAQPVDSETGADPSSLFAVPETDPAGLLQFIEKVAQIAPAGDSVEAQQAHVDRATGAILEASQKILASERNAAQLVDAIEWQVEALSVRAQFLADENAENQINAIVTKYKEHPRQEVVAAASKIEFMRTLRRWPLLEDAQRTTFLESLAQLFSTTDSIQLWQFGLLMQTGDLLADSEWSSQAAELFEQVLPQLRASSSAEIKPLVASAEGLARRLSLPGKVMELEGSLLDGSKLDWDSYRGRVVLVDYWATWCGPCKQEIPNVLENYRLYHDKGFEVLGICLNESRSEVDAYLQQANIPWRTMYSADPQATGWDHPMAMRYAITGIPRAVLVDQKGVVVEMNARGPRLGAALRKLLGEPATADALPRTSDTLDVVK